MLWVGPQVTLITTTTCKKGSVVFTSHTDIITGESSPFSKKYQYQTSMHSIVMFWFLNQQWLIEWNQSVSPVSEIMYSKCMQREIEALRLSTRYRCVYCTLQTELAHTKHSQLFSFQSLGSDPLASHEVAKLPFNRAKNRFANIFPCECVGLLCVITNSLLWHGEEADKRDTCPEAIAFVHKTELYS